MHVFFFITSRGRNLKIDCKGWLKMHVFKTLFFLKKKKKALNFSLVSLQEVIFFEKLLSFPPSYQWTFSLKIESESSTISV